MKGSRKAFKVSRKVILGVGLAVVAVAALSLVIGRLVQGESGLTFTAESVTQFNPAEGEQDSPYVKAEVVGGEARLTIATGYDPAPRSALRVRKASLSHESTGRVLTVEVTRDITDDIGSPANPRVTVTLPNLEPESYKVIVNVTTRRPHFTQAGVEMEITGTQTLETTLVK